LKLETKKLTVIHEILLIKSLTSNFNFSHESIFTQELIINKRITRYSCLFFLVGAYGFTRQELPEGLVITTTRSHSTRVVTECIEAYEPTSVLRVGGAGHKVNINFEKIHQ